VGQPTATQAPDANAGGANAVPRRECNDNAAPAAQVRANTFVAPARPVDPNTFAATAAAAAAHSPPPEMSIEEYCQAHRLHAGINVALNLLSAAVPQQPWPTLAASFPMDVCVPPPPTVPPASAAAAFAQMLRQWQALNVCAGR